MRDLPCHPSSRRVPTRDGSDRWGVPPAWAVVPPQLPWARSSPWRSWSAPPWGRWPPRARRRARPPPTRSPRRGSAPAGWRGQVDAGLPLQVFGSDDWGTTVDAGLALAATGVAPEQVIAVWDAVVANRELVVAPGPGGAAGPDNPGRLAKLILFASVRGQGPPCGGRGPGPGPGGPARGQPPGAGRGGAVRLRGPHVRRGVPPGAVARRPPHRRCHPGPQRDHLAEHPAVRRRVVDAVPVGPLGALRPRPASSARRPTPPRPRWSASPPWERRVRWPRAPTGWTRPGTPTAVGGSSPVTHRNPTRPPWSCRPSPRRVAWVRHGSPAALRFAALVPAGLRLAGRGPGGVHLPRHGWWTGHLRHGAGGAGGNGGGRRTREHQRGRAGGGLLARGHLDHHHVDHHVDQHTTTTTTAVVAPTSGPPTTVVSATVAGASSSSGSGGQLALTGSPAADLAWLAAASLMLGVAALLLRHPGVRP